MFIKVLYKDSKKKIIFELSGNAGAGKTTMIQRLTQSNNFKLYKAKPKILTYFYASIIAFVITILFVQPSKYIKGSKLIFKKLVIYISIEQEHNGFFLIEEGPWHLIYGNIASRMHKGLFINKIFQRYFVRLLKPQLSDILIHINAPPETLYERRKKRNTARDQKVSYNCIEESAKLLDGWIAYMRKKYPEKPKFIELPFHDIEGIKLINTWLSSDSISDVDLEKIFAHLESFPKNRDTHK